MRKANAILTASLFLGLLAPIHGQAAIDYPSPTQDFYVADYADLLSDENEQLIIAENVELQSQTAAQICVLTVEDLSGDSVENYANETFRKWGIGDAKENNGVLILVSKGDRKDRIEVGYGLEGDLTDALCADILKDGNAYLKDNDWESGIMTIYTEVAEKVHSVYDVPYTPGYAGAGAGDRASADAGADGANADADADADAGDASTDEEYEIGDAILGSLFFQIPATILFVIVYFIRVFGDHGGFIRFLQVIFSVLFGLGALLLILGDGLDILLEYTSIIGVGYVLVAGFNAVVGALLDRIGIGGGGGSSGYYSSSDSSDSGWSSGGGYSGGGGSSGGGGASGSF